MSATRTERRNAPAGPANCEECRGEFASTLLNQRFCNKSCASRGAWKAAPDRRTRATPLTLALRSGVPADILGEVLARVEVSPAGCHIWPSTNGSGYPIASAGRGSLLVHRLVLEVSTGARLGQMQAHHLCGVTACVNPGHLAPATRRENVAEMLERRALRTRIAQLEAALRSADPAHPELLWTEGAGE